MRKIFLIILFCGINSQFFSQGWVAQPSGTSVNLRSVFFTSSLTGWAAGDDGTILKTTNGGTNWTSQSSGLGGFSLNSLYFLSSSTGWCAGGNSANGAIGLTTNGGTNWLILSTSIPTPYLNSIYFRNASTGFTCGRLGLIYKTTNGGINWFSSSSGAPSTTDYNSIHFISDSRGTVVSAGTAGSYILSTTNAGLNWTIIESSVSWGLHGLYYSDAFTGWAVGGGTPSPTIFKTTNGGSNWIMQTGPLPSYMLSVFSPSTSIGWCVGFGGIIINTTNGGTSWTEQTSGTPHNLRSVYFISTTTGWAVGDLGAILKTTNGGVTAISPIGNYIPENFKLHQNYPNPFNPITKIRFDVPFLGRYIESVKLVIYDILGREIKTLVNEKLSAGTYEIDWNGAIYPSGVYFYKLEAGNFVSVKKMSLLK